MYRNIKVSYLILKLATLIMVEIGMEMENIRRGDAMTPLADDIFTRPDNIQNPSQIGFRFAGAGWSRLTGRSVGAGADPV